MAYRAACVLLVFVGLALGVYGESVGDGFAELCGVFLIVVGAVRATIDPATRTEWE